jgi:coniferyl-aldehyde dehydrogenase
MTSELNRLLALQKQAFQQEPFPDTPIRRDRLNRMIRMVQSNLNEFCSAVSQDFSGRSVDETLQLELIPSVEGARYYRKHVGRWMKPVKRSLPLVLQPAKAQVVVQPLGVVGIITTWNYPLYMAMGPLSGALAAGNRALIKVSEHAPASGAALKHAFSQWFEESEVAVVEGDAQVGAAFSALPLDHLLFTGSTMVGRKIMAAAAPNLTPVTLELGGKSPAIVTTSFPLAETARRLVWGKSINAGQTCVAPDYVCCPKDSVDTLVSLMKESYQSFFPQGVGSEDHTAIIHQGHYQRLRRMIQDAQDKGATVIPLGQAPDGSRKWPLTLITGVRDDMLLMQEEIFGPLLPIVPYDHLSELISELQAKPRPLALYYFGASAKDAAQVARNTHAGGMCHNDCVLHVGVDDLPFGGIGPSGMGHYHGKEGFLTFSKTKAVFSKGRLNSTSLIYPPYGKSIQQWIYRYFLGKKVKDLLAGRP